MNITRRESLMIPVGLALAAAMPAPQSLKSLAKAKGMRFGSAVGAGDAQSGSFRNPHYAALLETECSLLVPENELKWQATRPNATDFDFRRFDEQLAYATAKGLAMRGHNLLWHRPQWMPAWLNAHDFGTHPATEAERLLTNHIVTVCTRYKGRISSFDVVNETVMPDTGLLSESVLSKAMGGTQALVDLAFHTARAAAPGAQLVYNDYMSWETGNETHRNGVLKLLEGFKKRTVPVDALGIQSHIIPGPIHEREWRRFIDAVVAMGYELLITEFDVNDQALPANIPARDQSVAACAKAYLDLMFSYPQLKDVLVWGMCDSYSWLQNFEPLRSDGEAKRPCVYDAQFIAKPLRSALAAAFEDAAQR